MFVSNHAFYCRVYHCSLCLLFLIILWLCLVLEINEKKRKRRRANFGELSSADRCSQKKCQQVQTSYIEQINIFLVCYVIKIFFVLNFAHCYG